MKCWKFNAAIPFQYNFAGKFTAPNAEWMHMTRQLYDFELFVVTRGTLYIADGDTEHTVGTGHFLLMPPTAKQHGFRASDCAFYWLHFTPLTPWEALPEVPAAEPDAITLTIPETGTLRFLGYIIHKVVNLQHISTGENSGDLRLAVFIHESAVCNWINWDSRGLCQLVFWNEANG